MKTLRLAALALTATVVATPVLAQTAPDAPPPAQRRMVDYLVNAPHVQNWFTWGLEPAPTPEAIQGVTGNQALTFRIARAGDPWAVGAVMTNPAPIQAGDIILAAVWVRTDAATPVSLPLLMVEGQTEPKAVIARSTDVAIGTEWTLVYASGTAPADFAPGQTSIILQMGRDAQTLQLGPGMLFDMGPDYDPARLPSNPTSR